MTPTGPRARFSPTSVGHRGRVDNLTDVRAGGVRAGGPKIRNLIRADRVT
jgi:hypothetical protein